MIKAQQYMGYFQPQSKILGFILYTVYTYINTYFPSHIHLLSTAFCHVKFTKLYWISLILEWMKMMSE